jgi:hypothetical protein
MSLYSNGINGSDMLDRVQQKYESITLCYQKTPCRTYCILYKLYWAINIINHQINGKVNDFKISVDDMNKHTNV